MFRDLNKSTMKRNLTTGTGALKIWNSVQPSFVASFSQTSAPFMWVEKWANTTAKFEKPKTIRILSIYLGITKLYSLDCVICEWSHTVLLLWWPNFEWRELLTAVLSIFFINVAYLSWKYYFPIEWSVCKL